VTTRLVLASASPRRQALLAALGLTFDIVATNVVETLEGDPAAVVVDNARAKRAEAASLLDTPAVVIAADTLVFLDGQALGKPTDAAGARAMLGALSGKTHEVLTGLAVIDTATGKNAEGFERTRVTFRSLTPREVDRFVETVNPVDRAGAYTVDGPGSLLVARYDGCYQNVLGLPIVRLDLLLREVGYGLFDAIDRGRARFL